MAQGCDISGLSTWFGNFLENILPTDIPVLCLFIIGIFSIIGTEVNQLISSQSHAINLVLLVYKQCVNDFNHSAHFRDSGKLLDLISF